MYYMYYVCPKCVCIFGIFFAGYRAEGPRGWTGGLLVGGWVGGGGCGPLLVG